MPFDNSTCSHAFARAAAGNTNESAVFALAGVGQDGAMSQADQRESTTWDWLTRGRPLPTTAAGAEQAVVILIVGTRLGAILQMAP